MGVENNPTQPIVNNTNTKPVATTQQKEPPANQVTPPAVYSDTDIIKELVGINNPFGATHDHAMYWPDGNDNPYAKLLSKVPGNTLLEKIQNFLHLKN